MGSSWGVGIRAQVHSVCTVFNEVSGKAARSDGHPGVIWLFIGDDS